MQIKTFASLAALAGAGMLLASDESAATGGSEKAKAKTVADDMDSRRIFNNAEEASNYLNACAESFSDFGTIPLASAGIDDEGNFDPEIYTDSMQVMVATLRKQKEGVKAIVVAPVPSLESLLSDDSGTDWVKKIIQKELNHVAVRALRDVSDVSTVLDQIPTTRGAYISAARDSGGILETFNELYKQINATMGAKLAVWNKARLVKSDLKKAMESKGYAEEFYPSLENRGDKPSLFELALQVGIGAAKKKGLDPTIFERWLETRNEKTFTASEEEEDDFDVGSLTESLLKEDAKDDAKEEAPATAE
jgi:hypothetical protein